MPTRRINRFSLFALVAACGLGLFADNRAIGNDCECETACLECPPNSCDCANECPSRRGPNYAYLALDAVAGGIEKLLGLNKLNCGGACGSGGCDSGGCDDLICDDGCDPVTLEALSIPSPPVHAEDQWQGNQWQGNQWQGNQWQGQPQAPRTEMRMSEPSLIQPSVIQPHVLEPSVIEPQIQQQRPLSDPFRDDARVRTKRQVRRTIHQQPKTRSAKKWSPKRYPTHRHSRSYTSSNPSARTIR